MNGTLLPGPTASDQTAEIVYLVAPSGNPNYGDEFIVRSWLRQLARNRPDAQVVVDCHTPAQAAVLLSRWHPRVAFVDTVWRMCFECAELPAEEAAAVVEDVLDNPGRMPRIVSGIELLSRANALHLVGGGYLNVVWSHHTALLATASAAARRYGVRAIATGQGLLPVGDQERLDLLKRLSADFTVFDVRDEPSHQLLAGQASFSGDDAWLGVGQDRVYDTESPASQREFVFCLQSDLMDDFADGQGTDGLTAVVSDMIERWDLRGEQVAFIEAMPGADRLVYDKVVDRLPGAVFVPFTEVWNRGMPARAGQTWVSTRFHAHLLAAAAGASGIALSGRRDYYPVKHQSLVDAGSGWVVTETAPATPPTGGGFAPERVEELCTAKRQLAATLYPPVTPPKWPSLRRAAGAVRDLTRRN